MFFGEVPSKKGGEQQRIDLLGASQTKIQRHVKVRGDANPYAPEDELYFEQRRQQRMEPTLTKGSVAWRLWKAQKGKCPQCQQAITEETPWQIHHKRWRVYGGGDDIFNKQLLHTNGHRQVHSQGIGEEKGCVS